MLLEAGQFGIRSGIEKALFNLQAFDALFWDFDGVIKESVDVKTQAYEQLFTSFGAQVSARVSKHHEANGGMSRFDKLPIYLEWAGLRPTVNTIHEYSEKFGHAVIQKVIDSPWVSGVERVLHKRRQHQIFVLVSATPQAELEFILKELGLTQNFAAIYGAPVKKSDAIAEILRLKKLTPERCLMIGDATADMAAAEANQVPFLLRRHASNTAVFADYDGPHIEDFSNL